jgi:phosphoenolpyruvate carboxykinase (ATP)
VPGLDLDRYNPVTYYSPEVYRQLVEELRRERRQWLAKYRGLKPEIVAAIEPPGN